MKVKNKLKKETIDIPYSEFRIKFAKEWGFFGTFEL